MPKNPCKQAALYLLRRFTSSTPRKLMTNSMAGLLTYSGNRGLPNRHNQWLSVFSEPFLEFTAAGLFGTYTRFPINRRPLDTDSEPFRGQR